MLMDFDFLNDDFDWDGYEPTYKNPHGKCVKVHHEAYGDWHEYEDGYCEFESIGD